MILSTYNKELLRENWGEVRQIIQLHTRCVQDIFTNIAHNTRSRKTFFNVDWTQNYENKWKSFRQQKNVTSSENFNKQW